MPKNETLVGVAEVAEIAKVTSSAICNWQRRYPDFPRPIAKLHLGPVWYRKDIERWLKEKPKWRRRK